jgi:hypothetical protein
MGPYCQFCDFRCFVERRLPFTTDTFLMATCQRGMAHDRAKTGHDHTTAINPAAAREAEAARALAKCCLVCDRVRERDSARGIAVDLEQQVAALAERMRVAQALLPELGGCTCVGFDGCDDQGDDDLVFDREVCSWCKVRGLLSTEFLDPAGMDVLLAALEEVSGS